MKKLLVAILVLALAALSVVNCFAADVSTAVTDLDLLFFDDFSDKNKADYEASDDYIAEIDGDALFIQPMTSSMFTYVLPGSPELTGLDKMTIVYRFKYEAVDHNKALLVSFGGDETNFYTIGFNLGLNFVEGEGEGVKAYYAPIENNKLKKFEGGTGSTRRWQYQGLTEGASKAGEYYMLNGDDWYTFIFELEKGKEPVFTFYTNNERVVTYGGEVFGGGSLADGGDYLFSTDPDFTLDGKIGIVRTGTGMYIDGIAFYKTTNLDHSELVAKVASEGGAGSSESADDTTAPADDTTAPPADDTTVPPADDTTAPPADDTTAPPADDTTKAPADDTTAPPASGGCGGVIGVGAMVAILGCAVVLKKRENR